MKKLAYLLPVVVLLAVCDRGGNYYDNTNTSGAKRDSAKTHSTIGADSANGQKVVP